LIYFIIHHLCRFQPYIFSTRNVPPEALQNDKPAIDLGCQFLVCMSWTQLHCAAAAGPCMLMCSANYSHPIILTNSTQLMSTKAYSQKKTDYWILWSIITLRVTILSSSSDSAKYATHVNYWITSAWVKAHANVQVGLKLKMTQSNGWRKHSQNEITTAQRQWCVEKSFTHMLLQNALPVISCGQVPFLIPPVT